MIEPEGVPRATASRGGWIRSRRAIGLIVAYVVAVFVGAALLAYPLFQFLEWFGTSPRFSDVVFKLLQILGLLGLWPLLWALGLNRRESWGVACDGRELASGFARGIGIGFVALAPVVLILLGLEVRVFPEDSSWAGLYARISWIDLLTSGLVIALLEELWFRGALYAAFLEGTGVPWITGLATAVVFASLHFLRPGVDIAPEAVDPWSGWVVIRHCFHRFDLAILDSWLALVAVGLLLTCLRVYAGHIAVCIGAHCVWVWMIKVTRRTTENASSSDWSGLAGEYDGVIGGLSAVVFAIMVMVFCWRFPWILSHRSGHRRDANTIEHG